MMFSILLSLLFLPKGLCILCRSDYTLINGQLCLKYFSTPALHAVAENNCKLNGGTLVTVKNVIDNVAITNFARAAGGIEIWMGLSIFGNSVVNGYFDDASGITAYFNNYVPGYPSISSGFCATMLVGDNFGANQGKWRNANCNHQNNPAIKSFTYVCEVPPTYSASSCEINYGGNCYWRSKTLVNGALMNFVDATTVCAQRGAKLASIHSKIEVDFIKQQYKGTNVKAIMLGAQAVSNTTYIWTDSTPYNFNYINPLTFQTGGCLMMEVGGNGLWNQIDCTRKLDFLCKKKIAPTIFALPERPPIPFVILDSSNCNQDFVMASNTFSSYPAYDTPSVVCKWQLLALGPYRVGIFVDFWQTNGVLDVYDVFGTNIGHYGGVFNRYPFSLFSPFNVARVTFTPANSGTPNDKGFHAVILPI
ncbi:hypothetical protein L5515_006681 [Caenorhabditis briggsae]|uniref:C-type lectin domain-containing protein n=1 Tax=Caenorhabditis briggsae TaxID=6238 RepID=A0AAE9JK98_CAEBR|nr:hypothetical protein L5515_006681 [Caenorhabditis briggsae]